MMNSRFLISFLLSLFFLTNANGQDYEALAAQLLEQVKQEQSTTSIQNQLAEADKNQLAEQLNTQNKKLAFWINVYNSYIVILLRENPKLFENRDEFFTKERVTIAGHMLSFDDLEHGILRNSQNKLGLGYMGKIFTDDFEDLMKATKVDPRIHFALNCGAESCPPVEIYRAETIAKQLEERTKSYLKKHSKYDPSEQTVTVTPLMSWFRGDFGGMDGVRDFLKQRELLPQKADPEIEFEDYDWTLNIQNFAE